MTNPQKLNPQKLNPLKLNPLQARTLALLQQMARVPSLSEQLPDGGAAITGQLHAHGAHVHIGDYTVSSRDVSGLGNPAVLDILGRKGMLAVRDSDGVLVVTALGRAYETGSDVLSLTLSDH